MNMDVKMRFNTLVESKLQQGSAMLMALLILIVLTLLGVFASSSGIMQERMSGNFRDSARAFEAAEAGARWVEAWFASLRDVSQQPFTCDGTCTAGTDIIWEIGNYPGDLTNQNAAWWNSNGAEYGIDPSTLAQAAAGANNVEPIYPEPYVSTQPRIVVEHSHFARDTLGVGTTGVHFYRITSRAAGGVPNNVAVVESTFARRYE